MTDPFSNLPTGDAARDAAIRELVIRSHQLRYEDRYSEERTLLREAEARGLACPYLEERAEWHRLPEFDRLVPRAALELPREEGSIPSPATLEQLCFVTALGSDAPYYQVGVELIESIRNTRTYRETPVCILDTGLTDESRHELLGRFSNLTIRDPGLDLDVAMPEKDFNGNARTADGLKGCLARPFIPKHFPGYRYYVWMDTDTWVQDERSLDLFITAAEKAGLGSVVTPNALAHSRFDGSWWHGVTVKHSLVPEHYLPVLMQSPTISAGTFCIDVQSGFFELWAGYMKESVNASGQVWGPDEVTFMYTRQRHFPITPVLELMHNFAPNNYGPPIHHDGVLLTPYSAEIIGIIHFCGVRKDVWFVPVLDSAVPVDIPLNKKKDAGRPLRSIHFRVWPWQDKAGIQAFLERCGVAVAGVQG